ncbi:uncharacterized protein MELLADRAFT_65164 [Melampsora larici-populina 98AG31]|uniref:Uncharacterized protein n=1 Tax=Melampsora larici-populina (strain 98AG31 / pathotype 3-4-7) TaxID=747676 RepID=F4RU74_MELLP|nr:uncharacterized protein MELLADRAFT_65164 [Melampsora larici-populina 98AG31]EGG04128.1 hypothetical protein MELLADRAFT_65164 [Melampsora larici-populina 98AG31]
MNFFLIKKTTTGRFLASGSLFAFRIILFSKVERVVSPEISVQNGSGSFNEENNGGQIFGEALFPVSSQYRTMGLWPSRHQEGITNQVNYHDFNYGSICNPESIDLSNGEIDQASRYAFTPNNMLGFGSPDKNNELERTGSINFHPQDFSIPWYHIWDEPGIHGGSVESKSFEPHNVINPTTGSYSAYNPHLSEITDMRYSSPQIPDQNVQNTGNILEDGHISSDRINHIMESFPDYDHIYSEMEKHNLIPIDLDQQIGQRIVEDTEAPGCNNHYGYHIEASTPSEHEMVQKGNLDIDIPQYTSSLGEYTTMFGKYPARSQVTPNSNNRDFGLGEIFSMPSNTHKNPESLLLYKNSPLCMAGHNMPPKTFHNTHQQVRQHTTGENTNNPYNYPQRQNFIGDFPLGNKEFLPEIGQNFRTAHMSEVNSFESQDFLEAPQLFRSSKRKSTDTVEKRFDGGRNKLPRKSVQNVLTLSPREIKLMKHIKENSRVVYKHTYGGISRREMVQTIQDMGMSCIKSDLQVYSHNKKWFRKWEQGLVNFINALDVSGPSSGGSPTFLLNAIKKVDSGIIMGFLGLLQLIEPPGGLELLNEGLEFIESYLDHVSASVMKNLPHLTKKIIPAIDISSGPLEVFMSLFLVDRKRNIRIELYHNIWHKWKCQKFPSIAEVPLGEFTSAIYGMTLPYIKEKKRPVTQPVKKSLKLEPSRRERSYKYNRHISRKGRECMDEFDSIFEDTESYFANLKKDMTMKLTDEKINLTKGELMHFRNLLLNAVSVVKITVVEGFFGIIKCVHEEHNLDWDIEPILISGWTFFKNYFSLWKSLPLEILFLGESLAKFEKQVMLNSDLKSVAEYFHSVMKASHTKVISVNPVLNLLGEWRKSFNTDQDNFKVFQMILRSYNETPFSRWFKFQY